MSENIMEIVLNLVPPVIPDLRLDVGETRVCHCRFTELVDVKVLYGDAGTMVVCE